MFEISFTWIIARMDTSDLIMPVASWCCCEWFDRHQKCVIEAYLHFHLELDTPGLSECPHRRRRANVEKLYLENYLRTCIFDIFLFWGGRGGDTFLKFVQACNSWQHRLKLIIALNRMSRFLIIVIDRSLWDRNFSFVCYWSEHRTLKGLLTITRDDTQMCTVMYCYFMQQAVSV